LNRRKQEHGGPEILDLGLVAKAPEYAPLYLRGAPDVPSLSVQVGIG